MPADAAGIHAAARLVARGSPDGPQLFPDFARDGVLFVHREAVYTPGAYTPLAMTWKDGGCSPYVVDTDSRGQPLAQQQLTLRVSPDGSGALLTDDDPPVAVTTLGACDWSKYGQEGQAPSSVPQAPGPGSLLRLAAPPGALIMDVSTGVVSLLAPLHVLSTAPGRKARPDVASKLAFQAAARAGCGVPLDALLAAGGAA